MLGVYGSFRSTASLVKRLPRPLFKSQATSLLHKLSNYLNLNNEMARCPSSLMSKDAIFYFDSQAYNPRSKNFPSQLNRLLSNLKQPIVLTPSDFCKSTSMVCVSGSLKGYIVVDVPVKQITEVALDSTKFTQYL